MPLRLLLLPLVMFAFTGAAAAQERQWSLDASDQDAYLIFGVADSDDVGVSMWCQIRQGSVNIFMPEAGNELPAGKDTDVTLQAGEDHTVLTGKVEVNEDSGSSSIEAQLPADSPFFDSMKRADRLRITAGGTENVFPLVEADLGGLLDLCRKN